MKYQITHLKAPWPEGTAVGDVFEAGDGPVPAWAMGKVKPADEGAKVNRTLPRRKAGAGEDGSGPIKGNTPESKKQQAAETIEERELREREEKNQVVTNGGPATPPPSEAAAAAAEGKKPK